MNDCLAMFSSLRKWSYFMMLNDIVYLINPLWWDLVNCLKEGIIAFIFKKIKNRYIYTSTLY